MAGNSGAACDTCVTTCFVVVATGLLSSSRNARALVASRNKRNEADSKTGTTRLCFCCLRGRGSTAGTGSVNHRFVGGANVTGGETNWRWGAAGDDPNGEFTLRCGIGSGRGVGTATRRFGKPSVSGAFGGGAGAVMTVGRTTSWSTRLRVTAGARCTGMKLD